MRKNLVESTFISSFIISLMSSLAYAVGPMVDGAVVGGVLGVDSFAAYQMIWPATLIYALIGTVISGGSRTVYNTLLGRGNVREANESFTLAAILSVILSVLMMVLTFVFADQLAGLLGAKGNLIYLQSYVKKYLYGYVIGLPAMNLAKILSGFMQVDGDGKRSIYSVIIMTVVDIAGDLFAVFVIHGEMFTVALCTSIGNIIYLVVLWLHFCRRSRLLRWVLPKLSSTKSQSWHVLKNGFTTGMTRLAATAGSLAINHIITINAGAVAFAAYGVHTTMKTLIGSVYLGAADTVWSLSGLYYGEGDVESLKQMQNITIRFGLIISVITGVLTWISAPFLASIYMSSKLGSGFVMAVEAVRFFAFSVPLFMLVYCFEDYLMGVHRLRFANLYTILLECVAVVAVVYLMVAELKTPGGGWFATPINLAVMTLICILYVLLQREDGGFSKKRLLLNSKNRAETCPMYTAEVSDTDGVMETSRQAFQFCIDNHTTKKTAFLTSLFIEEMGTNIIRYGGKKPLIQIRVMLGAEGPVLRISDNGKAFDPTAYYKLLNEPNEDPSKNIGIRMVVKQSRDITYMNTFKTNNLVIRLAFDNYFNLC